MMVATALDAYAPTSRKRMESPQKKPFPYPFEEKTCAHCVVMNWALDKAHGIWFDGRFCPQKTCQDDTSRVCAHDEERGRAGASAARFTRRRA
jgi:hypothetical protein